MVALRIPQPLADELSALDAVGPSTTRDLPPEVLDAAIVAQGLAAVVVLVRASKAVRAKVAEWMRARVATGEPVHVHISRTEVVEIRSTTSGAELDAVLDRILPPAEN